MAPEHLKQLVRTIPDFPKPGILFRDVTTLFLHPEGFKETTHLLSQYFAKKNVDKIVAIESRGFILGSVVAQNLGCGLVLARKKGKLPGSTIEITYDLEYGTDCIQIHRDAIAPQEKCLVIDDLLATGGTAGATCHLIESMGAEVAGCGFVINLPDLHGAKKLAAYDCHWLFEFAGH